jgi:hypothetical protein
MAGDTSAMPEPLPDPLPGGQALAAKSGSNHNTK